MPAPKGYSTRTLKDFIGHDFGASAPIKVDQVKINTFADVTGDHQWICAPDPRRSAVMPAPKGYSTRTLKDFIGHDFGASAPIKVDQVKINTFADVTGDHQWIHVDVERAQQHSPFGGPVAHGFLTLSLMAAAVASAGVVPADAQGVLNYGLDKIRFIAPVPAGAAITATFKLAGVEDKGDRRQLIRVETAVNVEGSDKPAIVGEVLAMVIG